MVIAELAKSVSVTIVLVWSQMEFQSVKAFICLPGCLGGPDNHLVRCAGDGYTCTGATGLELSWLRNSRLRAELARGVGHNTYGKPAWPNDLLYMFPICILAIWSQ